MTEKSEPQEVKFRELPISEDTTKSLGTMIHMRIENLMLAQAAGASPVQCLMAEICSVETINTAILWLLEDKGFDVGDLDKYMLAASQHGQLMAKKMQAQIMERLQAAKDHEKVIKKG